MSFVIFILYISIQLTFGDLAFGDGKMRFVYGTMIFEILSKMVYL